VLFRSLGKFLLLAALLARPVYGETQKPVADPRQQVKTILRQKGGLLPNRIIFISDLSLPKFPQLTEVDVEGFNKLSFVDIVAPLDVKTTLLVNNLPWPENDEDARLKTIFYLLEPDMVIVGKHDGKNWRLFTMVNGFPRVVARSPGPFGFAGEPRILLRWLLHSLGYDAVVTNVRGNVVTVIGISGDLEKAQVGRVINKSTDRYVVEAGTKDVAAELKLIGVKGSIAEFQILSAPKGRPPITVGSKVVF